jgi:hypothetical protein
MTTSDPLGQDLAQGQVDERDVEAVADASGGELDDRRHADADRRGHLPPQALHDRDDVVEERAPDPLAGARDDRSGDGEQQQVAAPQLWLTAKRREAAMMPPTAAIAEQSAKTTTRTRLTLMPARRDASALPPTA